MAGRRFAPLLFAAALAGPACAAEEPRPAVPEKEEIPAAGPVAASAAPATAAAKRGVVVHGDTPAAARAREELRPGVTTGADAPPQDGPVVRVRVERDTLGGVGRLPLPQPELPPVRFGLGPLSAPQGNAALPPHMRTVGPTVTDQQTAFGTPPVSAAGYPRPETGWAPAAAFEQDTRTPYPWNPATIPVPYLDPAWTPTPAWAPDRDERDWSPVYWTEPTFAPTWRPTDSFGRKVD
jgi:hypothetical protein